MRYKYHVQYQAIERANRILPIPTDYPLRPGLAEAFRPELTQLAEFARAMYLDMAENPEAYGLLLVDASEQNNRQITWGILRDSADSVKRPLEILYVMARSGEMDGAALKVHLPTFKTNIKEVSPAKLLDKYAVVLNRLAEFGFVFDGFAEKGFAKRLEYLAVSFPSNPGIIGALKRYCDCRAAIGEEKERVKEDWNDFRDNFYSIDYKYTADLAALPESAWVRDKTRLWDDEAREFYAAFYARAMQHPKFRYAGDFFQGSKLIAKLRYEDDYWKQDVGVFTDPEYRDIITKGMTIYFALILYLPVKGDKGRFDSLPPHIIEYMKGKKCQDCDAFASRKAKNGGKCPHTVAWAHGGEEFRSCSYYCFHFENPKVEDIPAYCGLL